WRNQRCNGRARAGKARPSPKLPQSVQSTPHGKRGDKMSQRVRAGVLLKLFLALALSAAASGCGSPPTYNAAGLDRHAIDIDSSGYAIDVEHWPDRLSDLEYDRQVSRIMNGIRQTPVDPKSGRRKVLNYGTGGLTDDRNALNHAQWRWEIINDSHY